MSNRNFPQSRIWTGHLLPRLLDCNFIVDSTNGNGLGIRSLKGPYIQNVYMHTSASPAAGNPNPAAGYIVIQFQDGFFRSISGFNAIISPPGANLVVTAGGAALTVGVAYMITVLGDATVADWIALGVPKGVTPAVGVAFIALATGAGTGAASRVAPAAAAGSAVMSIETVGDPNTTLSPAPGHGQTFGGQIIVAARDKTGAIAAPAAGSVISLAFLLNDSSVLIAGE